MRTTDEFTNEEIVRLADSQTVHRMATKYAQLSYDVNDFRFIRYALHLEIAAAHLLPVDAPEHETIFLCAIELALLIGDNTQAANLARQALTPTVSDKTKAVLEDVIYGRR